VVPDKTAALLPSSNDVLSRDTIRSVNRCSIDAKWRPKGPPAQNWQRNFAVAFCHDAAAVELAD